MVRKLKEDDTITIMSERDMTQEFVDNEPTNSPSSNNSSTQREMNHLDQEQYQVDINMHIMISIIIYIVIGLVFIIRII